MARFALLYIPSGECLCKWDPKEKKFKIATFSNQAIAGHALEDFSKHSYWTWDVKRSHRTNTVKRRVSENGYSMGLYPKEFIDVWLAKYSKSRYSIVDPDYSWPDLGLDNIMPSKDKPWPVEHFEILKLE